MSFLQKYVWSSDLPSTIDFDQSSSIYTKSDINHWSIELRENEAMLNLHLVARTMLERYRKIYGRYRYYTVR